MAEKNEMHAKTNTAEQPLVSILIPAYKARWFERALCSALAQDYPKLEILVYDNCPTEDIRDICARYPSVIYYRNPNMGPQNSLDIASASHGRYVKHLFDDDLLEPTCVSQLVAAIQQVTAADVMRRNTIHNYPTAIKDAMRMRGVLNRSIRKAEKRNEANVR